MDFVFAVQSSDELKKYKQFAEQYEGVLSGYVDLLSKKYDVRELPRCIVLTNTTIATKWLSDISLPAYTNDYRVVFVPELAVWRNLYLQQLDPYPLNDQTSAIRSYYETSLTDRYLLQIIGHELAHHSELFSDHAYENGGAWFEEGMVELISRRYFLLEQEYEAETTINKMLVELYEQTHAKRPLTLFGGTDHIATLYYDYWRAFQQVSALVDRCGGDVKSVLTRYAKDPHKALKSCGRISSND